MRSKFLAISLIICCFLISNFPVLAASSEGVYLYEHSDFGGKWIRVTCDVANLVNYDFNDKISSIRIIGNYEVTVYEDVDYEGWSKTYYGDTTYVGNNENDQISSLQIRRKPRHYPRHYPRYVPDPGHDPNPEYCPGPKPHEPSEGVYLYEHSDFGGKWLRVTSNVANLVNYDFNDKISSIRIIGPYKVTVYQHINYCGWVRYYNRDTRFVGDGSNDQISSIRIRRY